MYGKGYAAEPYSHSGEERKTRLRVCIFDGEAVKSAFAFTFDKSNKTFPKKFAISCPALVTDKKNAYIHNERRGF